VLEVRGPNVTLRLPAESDAPALFELASDPEVTRWFSWGPYTEPSQALDWVRRNVDERESGERLSLATVRGGEVLGIIELNELSVRDRRAMMGVWLGRRAWGTGVNGEAQVLLLALSFSVLGLRRVGAYANVDNARSDRALRKAGYVPEGRLRRWHRHGDAELDVFVYGVLAEEFAAPFEVEVRGEPPAAFVMPGATPS
jgi:ribosomal-protein-alanine N-acetyltransferase